MGFYCGLLPKPGPVVELSGRDPKPVVEEPMERARRSFINQRPSDLRKKQAQGWM